MPRVSALAERTVPADPATAYAAVRDYELRPRLLPDAYDEVTVQAGGQGAGTVFAYRMRAGGRERRYRMQVSEPAERTLVEDDAESSLVTTWRVLPAEGGARVTVSTEWEGAGGVGGFFERRFAPAGVRRLHEQVLDRLSDHLRRA